MYSIIAYSKIVLLSLFTWRMLLFWPWHVVVLVETCYVFVHELVIFVWYKKKKKKVQRKKEKKKKKLRKKEDQLQEEKEREFRCVVDWLIKFSFSSKTGTPLADQVLFVLVVKAMVTHPRCGSGGASDDVLVGRLVVVLAGLGGRAGTFVYSKRKPTIVWMSSMKSVVLKRHLFLTLTPPPPPLSLSLSLSIAKKKKKKTSGSSNLISRSKIVFTTWAKQKNQKFKTVGADLLVVTLGGCISLERVCQTWTKRYPSHLADKSRFDHEGDPQAVYG